MTEQVVAQKGARAGPGGYQGPQDQIIKHISLFHTVFVDPCLVLEIQEAVHSDQKSMFFHISSQENTSNLFSFQTFTSPCSQLMQTNLA